MGSAPTGYIHSINEKKEKVIIPDPERAPYVRKIFELYARGEYSLHLP
jgi:hypothetical protein